MFNVGAQLRRMRRRSNLTLDQLAATSGVDRGTISRIELGHVSPRIDTISFLCEAMGSTLAQFFGGQEGGEEGQDASPAAHPGGPDEAAEPARPASLSPAGGADGAPRPALGLGGSEPDGYWPVPSHFWHGMLEVLDRFEALVKNSSELILVFDRTGHVLYASPAIRTILGRRSQEVVGRHYRTMVHPGDLDRLEEFLAALAPGATDSLDYRLRHKDGSWRTLSARFCNMLDNPSVVALVSNGLECPVPVQG
jgi:PAS domain S-box-containing protein